jgi:hypothetical protein
VTIFFKCSDLSESPGSCVHTLAIHMPWIASCHQMTRTPEASGDQSAQ